MTPDETKSYLRNLDHMFYQQFDPFFHFVLSELIVTGNVRNFRVSKDGEKMDDNLIISILNESRDRKTEYSSSLIRMFRYFSSETLLVLILAGMPDNIFYDVSSNVRGTKLNAIFKDISSGVVPANYDLNLNGKALNFLEWISYLLFKDVTALTKQENDIEHLIMEEAELLMGRGAINSFKHCRPLTYGKSALLTLTNNQTGEDINSIQLTGRNWFDWKSPNKKNGITISYNSEEIIQEEDQLRIFQVSQLMQAIKEIRLASFEDNSTEQNIHCTLPQLEKKCLIPRRQNFTIHLNPKDEVGRT